MSVERRSRARYLWVGAFVVSCLLVGWLTSARWVIVHAAFLLVLDRILLFMEARRWINYRRVGLSRGAATYHTLQLSSAFDPGFQEIIEVKYASEKEQDDAGGPPAREDPPSDSTPADESAL